MDHKTPRGNGEYSYAPTQSGSSLPFQHALPTPVPAEFSVMHLQSSLAPFGSFVPPLPPPPPPQYLQAGLSFDATNPLAPLPPQLWSHLSEVTGNMPYTSGLSLQQPPQPPLQEPYPSQVQQSSEFKAPRSLSDAYYPSNMVALGDSKFEPSSHASVVLPNLEATEAKTPVQSHRRIVEQHKSGSSEIMPIKQNNIGPKRVQKQSMAEYRDRALQAIREMVDNGISFHDILNHGQISGEEIPLLERLFKQANRPLGNANVKAASQKKVQQNSSHLAIVANTGFNPTLHKLPAKLEEPKAAQQSAGPKNPLPKNPLPVKPNTTSAKSKTGTSTSNRPAPKSRQDYLAALSAAKASAVTRKDASSQSSVSPAPDSKPLTEASSSLTAVDSSEGASKPLDVPIVKPASDSGSNLSTSIVASESTAAKRLNDRLREKIALLKGGTSERTTTSLGSTIKEAPVAASSPSTIDYGSRQNSATPVQKPLDIKPNQPSAVPASNAAPSQSPTTAIPGLFMSGQTVSTSQIVSTTSSSPQSQSMARKRPAAADFLEASSITPKRPYMPSRLRSNEDERCIIELSDDDSSDDEGEVMDIDENNDDISKQESLDEMITSIQQSVKTPHTPKGQRRDTRTLAFPRIDSLPLSGMSTPQQRLFAEEAHRKEEEAKKLRERIERLEARKRMGNQSSPATAVGKPSLADGAAQSPHTRLIASTSDALPLTDQSTAPTVSDLPQRYVLQRESNTHLNNDENFLANNQAPKATFQGDHDIAVKTTPSTNTTGNGEDRDRKRRQQAELDAGIAQNLSAIEKLKLELQRLEEENLRKQQDRDRLVDELESMGVNTEGMSHEAMQIKMEKLGQEQEQEQPSPQFEMVEAPESKQQSPSVDESMHPQASDEEDTKSLADDRIDSSDEEGEISSTDDADELFVDHDPPDFLTQSALSQHDEQPPKPDIPTASLTPSVYQPTESHFVDKPPSTHSIESGEIDDNPSDDSSLASSEELEDDNEASRPDQEGSMDVAEDAVDAHDHNTRVIIVPIEGDAADNRESIEEDSGSDMKTSSEKSSFVEDEDDDEEQEADYEPEDIIAPGIPQESVGGAEIEDYEPDDIIADDLAPELQPAPTSTGNEMATVSSASRFTPYESALKIFKAYRHHPEYLATVPGGFQSNTYSHNIKPEVPLCPDDIISGECKLPGCSYQHFRDINLRENDMLVQLGMKAPTDDPSRQLAWRRGLAELIQTIRSQSASGDRSSSAIAAKIVEYRRQFLEDSSKILDLGDVSL